MLRSAAIILAALCALAPRAEAAELEGFGASKFGMTKEEAWDKTEGGGKWLNSNLLVHNYQPEDSPEIVKLYYYFKGDRLDEILITHEPARTSRRHCLARGKRFARVTEELHGVAPLVRKGTPIDIIRGYKTESYHTPSDIYVFTFKRGAYIEIRATASTAPNCWIDVWYHPPIASPMPF